MSNPRIEVDVVANVAGLATGVTAATTQLDKLGKAAQATAPQVDRLSKATSQYNVVGLDFARVIQDAPFGIIGVGNNITQLAQSFSTLGKAGDSLGTKVKLAFSQIFSSGNALILGVSLLTTAFTILQQQGFFKSEEAAKSLSDKLKEYEEGLRGVAAANLKGAQDAQKEISTLKGLELQATNTALSTKQRTDAVNELQKLYPEYFGNLTKEQIKNGDVGEAYIKVTESLIAKAKAQAATNAIAQNSIDLLTIETKLEEQRSKRLTQTASAQAQLDALIEKRQKEGFLTQGDLQRYDTLIKSINTANESLKEEEILQKEIVKIKKEDEQLIGKINSSLEQGGNLVKDNGKGIKSNSDALKEYSKGWDDFNLGQQTAQELQDKLTFSTKDFEKTILAALSSYQKIESKEVKIKTEVEGFEPETAGPRPFEVFLDDVAYQLDKLPELETRVAEFAKTINDLIKGNVTDAFIDLGYTIGETLATGGNLLTAIGGSLLKSFGRFLGQFGQQLIAYGVAASAFGKVSAALANPATAIIAAPLAIAAGIALTAIAGAIGSMGSKGPGGGGGGGGAGGGSAAQGSTFTGGAQGGLFAQNRDVSGEFVVRGNDLVYVLGQANNKINKG
jgi:hypothetical protein